MESDLFDWVEWDDIGEGCYQFYDVVLKTNIGDFSVGTKFEYVILDYQTGDLQLNNENESFNFKLGLVIKN